MRAIPAIAAAGCALSLAAAASLSLAGEARGAQGCRGAAAMQAPERCPSGGLRVTPDPAVSPAVESGPKRNLQFCRGGLVTNSGLDRVCSLGAPGQTARRRLAVIGDSHAAQWRPALDRIGRQRGWNFLSTTASSCDFGGATRPDPACAAWQRAVVEWLGRRPEIEAVIVGQVAKRDPRASRRYQLAWATLPASVKKIIVLRDAPAARNNVRSCIRAALAKRVQPGAACARAQTEALRVDGAALAAAAIGAPRAHVADMTRFFCDPVNCFPVIGGILVYADGSHMTPEFNLTLSPYLGYALVRALAN